MDDILDFNPELKAVLEKLTPEERDIISQAVASPRTKKQRDSAKTALITEIVKKYKDDTSYRNRAKCYFDLLKILFREKSDFYLKRKKVWRQCCDADKPKAVMMAIKKLNGSIDFSDNPNKTATELFEDVGQDNEQVYLEPEDEDELIAYQPSLDNDIPFGD